MSNDRGLQTDMLSTVHGFYVLTRAISGPFTDSGRDFSEVSASGPTNWVLLYHSAAFAMPPHAYQMAVLASLPDDAAKALNDDIDTHGENSLLSSGGYMRILHNLDSEPIALQQIVDYGPSPGNPFTFQAAIKRKSRDDYPLIGPSSFTVSVQLIVYFRPFVADEQYSEQYKVLQLPAPDGSTYLAHYLTRRPDFDAIQKGDPKPPVYLLGHSLESRSASYEVDLPGVAGYQGGDLPSASPLVVGRSYEGVNPSSGQMRLFTPEADLWFDDQGVNALPKK